MIKPLFKRHWGVVKGQSVLGVDQYFMICEDVFSPRKVMQAVASVDARQYDAATPAQRRGIVCGVIEMLITYNESFYAQARNNAAVECHPAFRKAAK